MKPPERPLGRVWEPDGTADPLPSQAEALALPLKAFPGRFLSIRCGRCGETRVVNEAQTLWQDMRLVYVLRRLRHADCGGEAASVELHSSVEGRPPPVPGEGEGAMTTRGERQRVPEQPNANSPAAMQDMPPSDPPDTTPAMREALAAPFAAFPSWFLRIECDRCHKVRMLNEAHATPGQRDMLLRVFLSRARHEGCGDRAGRAELLTGADGVSSRPVRRIVLRGGGRRGAP